MKPKTSKTNAPAVSKPQTAIQSPEPASVAAVETKPQTSAEPAAEPKRTRAVEVRDDAEARKAADVTQAAMDAANRAIDRAKANGATHTADAAHLGLDQVSDQIVERVADAELAAAAGQAAKAQIAASEAWELVARLTRTADAAVRTKHAEGKSKADRVAEKNAREMAKARRTLGLPPLPGDAELLAPVVKK